MSLSSLKLLAKKLEDDGVEVGGIWGPCGRISSRSFCCTPLCFPSCQNVELRSCWAFSCAVRNVILILARYCSSVISPFFRARLRRSVTVSPWPDPLFTGSISDCLDQKVSELLHDCESHLALGDESRESIDVGKVEEKRLEESLLDNGLEFFKKLTRPFQCLAMTHVSVQLQTFKGQNRCTTSRSVFKKLSPMQLSAQR